MQTRPNVLLIATDHWPGSLMRCAGHSIHTPTLDALAQSGVRFTSAYSECPVCIPARRTLMTGMSPQGHGMNAYQEGCPLPAVTTLAQAFRDNGYQAHAVGKLHVHPQRDRIGFDDALIDEEGRAIGSMEQDDYEIFLSENGAVGQRFAGGMGNNRYLWRPWHLDERLHVTNWASQSMSRIIKHRDPTRPAFWYLSYSHPHPPLAPLQSYLDMYSDLPIPEPHYGSWVRPLPKHDAWDERNIQDVRRAFYALCTHIDHQLRVVVGTLREEGVLDNTIIMFTSDHGDMLGNHNQWGKCVFYEDSANVPMIVLGTKGDTRVPAGKTDARVVGLSDVMPTLLTLAGLDVPSSVEGQFMLSETPRDMLYGEHGQGPSGTRMIRAGEHKLIYHPGDNRGQLFHIATDPLEKSDISTGPRTAPILREMKKMLMENLSPEDQAQWVKDGVLVGDTSPRDERRAPDQRHLGSQRGLH